MISIKTSKEIAIMAEAGRILAQIMEELKKEVKPGITTERLNKVSEGLIFKNRVKPSFKGYEGFPAALCASVNEEIVHAAPSERKLKEGDIISLDLGVQYRGYHADMAVTLAVGENVEPEALRLIRTTKKALKRGIRKIRPGAALGDIGNAVQRCLEGQGYGVIRDLCGHGIGRAVHEEPPVLNYGRRKTGLKLKEGMVICLEPMAAMGGYEIKKTKGGGYTTKDGSLSAHFEHTIAVTNRGCRVLTMSD